jgi:RNA-directed DNA polymerase
LATLRVHGARGGNHVQDADIRDYFGSIDQTKRLKLVTQRISAHWSATPTISW